MFLWTSTCKDILTFLELWLYVLGEGRRRQETNTITVVPSPPVPLTTNPDSKNSCSGTQCLRMQKQKQYLHGTTEILLEFYVYPSNTIDMKF